MGKYDAINDELTNRAKFFAKTLWHRNYKLPVRVNGRFRSSLGMYWTDENGNPHSIELSKGVLEDEYVLSDTLLHELCHWYCHARNKRFKDGSKDFEKELKRVGATSTRTDVEVHDPKILELNRLYKNQIKR